MKFLAENVPMSKWVGIPLIIFWIAVGSVIWFIPWSYLPDNSRYSFLESAVVRYTTKSLCSVAAIFAVLGTIAWIIPDKKDNKKE